MITVTLPLQALQLPEHRCPNCHRLLFKGHIEAGAVEIRCRICKTFYRLVIP